QVLDFIKEATTTDQVNLVGYCMGGIFSNIVTALDEKKSVRNVVSIGSPADFSQLPKYYALAQHLDRPLIKLADLCDGIPASVSRSIFQMMQPIKNLTLPINFVW
ncbi:MAG: alpha/beta fold hydrolase, partial [Blastocatellia bacterium]|nr:alpha/beta fold hydrolase [Blastocatellia bacterium]